MIIMSTLAPSALQAATEEWLVACTIASEVPPQPVHNPNSTVPFTETMIPIALRAVAEVIANRCGAPGFPSTPLGVVLAPKQFSGVLRGVSLRAVGHRDFWVDAVDGKWFPNHVATALDAWRKYRTGTTVALVPGATHYYSPVSMNPPHRVPSWAGALRPVPVPGLAPDYFRFFALS